MTEPCEKGWVLLHSATDNQVVRKVVAHSHRERVPGCFRCDLSQDEAQITNDDTKEAP